jgi:cytosine deaminase
VTFELDLIIRNAKTLEAEGLVDIAINAGKIVAVGNKAEGKGDHEEIDAMGNLVLPTFIEPHIHLDKVLLAERLKESASISEARQMVREAKRNFTKGEVQNRIEKVIPWGIENGVTVVRTHLDVDGYSKTTSIEAVLELKEKYKDLVDIQIVAFPQEGIIREPETLEFLRKALELGADVVGGLPEAEGSDIDSRKQIDELFVLAKEANLDLDVHCDVLPQFKNIEYFASLVMKNNYGGRATADHLIALSYYEDEKAAKAIQMIKTAGISVIANPCTMISSGGTEKAPKARGITRVKDMVNAGVNVAFGSDNIIDPYNPFGDFNPLSNGFLLAYGAQMNSTVDFETLLRMPTYNSARILRLDGYGLGPGSKADLNIFSQQTPRELLRLHQKPRYVIKKGRVLVENKMETVRNF